MSAQFNGKWFILYTRNKRESAVVNTLGFKSITPLKEKIKLVKGGKKVVLVPKYENYVFVCHDGSDTFFDTCIEHKDVVSFAGGVYDKQTNTYPCPMTDNELQSIVDSQLSQDLRPGVDAVIVYGPYENQQCTIISSNQRFSEVSINLNSACSFVETIPNDCLKKI